MKMENVRGLGFGRITHKEHLPGADIEVSVVVDYILHDSPDMQRDCQRRAFELAHRLAGDIHPE